MWTIVVRFVALGGHSWKGDIAVTDCATEREARDKVTAMLYRQVRMGVTFVDWELGAATRNA